MNIVNLQRRRPGPRADELLDALQPTVAPAERVRWNDTGHARLAVSGPPDDARATITARLAPLGDDWPEHIAIL